MHQQLSKTKTWEAGIPDTPGVSVYVGGTVYVGRSLDEISQARADSSSEGSSLSPDPAAVLPVRMHVVGTLVVGRGEVCPH